VNRFLKLFGLVLLSLVIVACQSKERTITVAATPVPHAEILEQVKEELKKEGITLKIIEVDDYSIPNRLLAERQVDANFFQHKPYLEAEIIAQGYDLAPLVRVHLEPLGIYSNKITTLDQLMEGATVAIPSDPTNESRALHLLEELGFLTLKKERGLLATTLDIATNPKNLKIEEIDAALLPRALDDVAIAIIPGNWVLQGGLDVTHALALESDHSPYANILVVRSGDAHREELQKLADLLNSEPVREFIKQKYKGVLLPAF